MIDLRNGLGAPPIVFPGVRLQHTGAPVVTPGSAPVMPINQAAQNCCTGFGDGTVTPSAGGVAQLAPWLTRQPLWVKIGIGVGSAGVLFGIGYSIYRAVR